MDTFTKYFIRYRAFVGIISLILVLLLAEPNAKSIAIGFFFIMAGTFFRAWASGFINKNEELATKGPYQLSRNPLYFGNFILGTGIALAANNLYSYIIFALYYFIFFPALMIIENKRMKEIFGEQYNKWSKNLNSFFPQIKKINFKGFNISYYVKNKEYKVIYFSLFIVIVLIFKALINFN
ncbi:MAG: methyltransferase [Acidobacteriota bacterium]